METQHTPPGDPPRRRIPATLIAAGIILIALGAVIGTTDNPPGIAAILIGVFALVLGIVYWVAKIGERSPGMQLLYWAPRALCIVFALFISLFALDVFGEGRGFWETVLALVMHLIPTFLILILLVISWRREWIAGVIFPVFGIFYIVEAWNKPFGTWSTFLLVAGPPVAVGILFLLNWRYRGILRPGT